MKSIIYEYENLLEDDFANFNRKEIVIDKNFKYHHKSILWNVICFILYYGFIYPFAFIYMKIKFRYNVIGKEKLKGYKSYFLYANHTQAPGDGFLPPLLTFHKPYFIVDSKNLSVKGTRNFMQMMGAIPIPNKIDGMKNFEDFLYKKALTNPIVIYPEAHIWPYYTKIRPFKSVSFRYPVKMNLNIFTLTNTYQKTKFFKRPKMVSYIDGPFFINEEIPFKIKMNQLRDICYENMVKRSQNSNYEYIYHYKKKEMK